MKIEKVNENQICCTLTKEDLLSRQMRLSELAYGTEKAKRLFYEMIRQASCECGFEPDDYPIMVEAIPMPEESIIVLITKVEYPEELDARFSDFSAFDQDEAEFEDMLDLDDMELSLPGADDIIDYFKCFHGKEPKSLQEKSHRKKPASDGDDTGASADLIQFFEFTEMGQVEQFALLAGESYRGDNSLYRLDREAVYVLILHKGDHSPEEFNRISNLASEYGYAKPYSVTLEARYREHGRAILDGQALQTLRKQFM